MTRDVVARAVAGCDIVFNNVAQVPLARDEQLLRTVNVDGTLLLLREARGPGWARSCTRRRARCSAFPRATPFCPLRSRHRSRPMAAPSSPPSGRASLPCRTASTSPSSGRAPSSGTVASGSSGSSSTGSPTAPTSSCSARVDNRYQFVHADDLAEVCILAAGVAGTGRVQRRHRSLRHDARVAGVAVRPRRHRARGSGRCPSGRQRH